MPQPSLRFVIGIFFFIILAVTWSLPPVLMFHPTRQIVRNTAQTLGQEVSHLILTDLNHELEKGDAMFQSVVNWTAQVGDLPYSSPQTRRQEEKQRK